MLSVTTLAKEKLKEALKNEKTDDDTCIRIASSSTTPGGIGFILDKEKQGDKIIKDEDGESLLLLGDEIVPVLTGMVLDYKNMGDKGMQFTITELK
jgi:Fe-S cluster assembly iron-binding protein IscA